MEARPIQGFILQPSYRIESGRPVVHLWGKLEDASPFLIRDDRARPHFYICTRDEARARALGASRMVASQRSTMQGDRVLRVEVATPADTPALRDRLHRGGVQTFEADVRFAMRYLIDRGIRGSLEVEGESSRMPGAVRVFENPRIAAADWTPTLQTLAIDIETDPGARELLSIALYGCGRQQVLLRDCGDRDCPAGAVGVSSEGELLSEFERRVRQIDPDILTGWNVVDFDLRVVLERAEKLGVRLRLGRGGERTRLRSGSFGRQPAQVVLSGRLVLDGLQLLRGAFVRMERHSLDFVARKVLGEGKLISGAQRGEDILWSYRNDRSRFVNYNLTDARLALEIVEKLQLIELAVERSRLTGLPPDRVSASIAAFDSLYLGELGRRGFVAPSVRPDQHERAQLRGGEVLQPEPGLYENVLVLDFSSLYPSLIRTFQIDPLGQVTSQDAEQDPIVAPNGATFRRQPGILPRLLDDLAPRRRAAQVAGREVESYAIKILMNSFFGVLGTPACRFYSPELAEAITSWGRLLLLWSQQRLQAWGHRVLYGDTDSLFVESGVAPAAEAERLARSLVGRLNEDLRRHILETWRVESRLELEFEKLYLRLFLAPVRHGSSGARKRYAGLVRRGDELAVEFTGLEAVRRDWTDLARNAQRELYRRLFFDEPVEEYLRLLVLRLRAGELDEDLIYRKALRKDLNAYTSTTPPHVAAARKVSGRLPDLISYVMTVQGPEPVECRTSAIDYQHYLDKQLQPVAEPILAHLRLDFARVLGEEHQLDLFPGG